MTAPHDKADIAVLGGGPGGYVAALAAARRGARVILIEKERVGGTCLNVGCIPTKVLTSATELLVRVKRAGDFGLWTPQATVDLPALMAYKRKTVEQLVGGVEQLLKARRVTLIHGEARLVKADTISIEDGKGGREEVSAQRIILAPGSVTATPPLTGSSLPGVMTSTEALDIETVPARLVVVGSGVIGLEFACIYEALGSKVTVLEMTPEILPGATDEVIAKRLHLLLRRRGMEVQTGTVVQRIEQMGEALRVFGQSAGAESATDCDRVLIATGRWPNTQGMGFAELGLRMNGRAIAVDERLGTNLPNVWAVGDAIGGWLLAHKAMVDGRVAAENATGGGRILGVHLLGPHVTDLIAEGALAVQTGATADDLAWTTHAHPTLPEAMLEAALGFREAALHIQTR